MKVTEFFEAIAAMMPEGEPWDRDGVNVDMGNEVTKILIALDPTGAAIRTAKNMNANLLVTHHNLIFNPISSVLYSDSVGNRLIKLIENGISHVSFHTRFDNLNGGVNDMLCELIGLKNTLPYLPFARIGEYEKPCGFNDFLNFVEGKLNIKTESCGNSGRPVQRVAVLAGGGKDYVRDAVKAGADTYLTGEMNHAAFIDCAEYGINYICATHKATEEPSLKALEALINKVFPNIFTSIYNSEAAKK